VASIGFSKDEKESGHIKKERNRGREKIEGLNT